MLFPDRNELQKRYLDSYEVRQAVSRDLAELVEAALEGLPTRPTVRVRTKSFESYYKKYLKILKAQGEEAGEPEITDLIGLRVICPFLEDLGSVEKALRERCDVREIDKKGAHFSFKEFGYESVHILLKIPADIIENRGDPGCEYAEVQVRTILQDAWSEVEHELVYKAEFTPFDEPLKRKLAAVNASLSLADMIFQEIRAYQRQLNGELEKRRDSFYRKIGDHTDALLFDTSAEAGAEAGAETGAAAGQEEAAAGAGQEEAAAGAEPQTEAETDFVPNEGATIDDLLLNALYAHNKGKFAVAAAFYSRILDLKPNPVITSLIYKHRGMANFAQSSYKEAIDDFSLALDYDKSSYKAAYYRAVVRSVQRDYEGAVEDFNLSLQINPYQNFTLYRRAQAYYHLGDFAAALADCDSSLALDPSFGPCEKLRGICRQKLEFLG